MPSTYEPIATTTLGSATSSVSFSSIPATYTDLRVIATLTAASYGNDVSMDFNGDSANNYSSTYIGGSGSTVTSGQVANNSLWRISNFGIYTDPTLPISMQVDIFSYAGSTFKTGLAVAVGDRNGSGYVGRNIGLYRITSALTTVRVFCNVNFSVGSTFTLYGIKNA